MTLGGITSFLIYYGRLHEQSYSNMIEYTHNQDSTCKNLNQSKGDIAFRVQLGDYCTTLYFILKFLQSVFLSYLSYYFFLPHFLGFGVYKPSLSLSLLAFY